MRSSAVPPPASFGRPAPATPATVALPDQMPAVQLPVVLVIDPESLARASRQLTEMVLHAVRAGYATAIADVEFEAESAEAYENPSAEFMTAMNEFTEANDALLDRLSGREQPETR